MKQTVFGVVCMLVLTFLAVLFMTIHGRTLRQTETDHALGEAIDAAMSNVMETKIYSGNKRGISCRFFREPADTDEQHFGSRSSSFKCR